MKWKSSEIRFTNRQTHTGHFACSALCVCAFAIGVRICVNFNLIDTHTHTHTHVACIVVCVCMCVLNLLRMAIVFEKGIIFFFQKKAH